MSDSVSGFLAESDIGLDQLFTFQQDSVDYLSDLPPSANNLFWAGNFNNNPDQTAAAGSRHESDSGQDFHNAQFRIRNVSFNLPSLSFETHKITHNTYLSKVTNVNQVTIGWIDDAYRSVIKYHLDWGKFWYDRKYDCLVIGARGKYRGLDVILYTYIEGNEKISSPVTSVPVIAPVLKLKLRGLAPQSLGQFNLDYSNPGNSNIVQYTYTLNRAEIIYGPNFNGKDETKDRIWRPSTEGVKGDNSAIPSVEHQRIQVSVFDKTDRYKYI